MPPSNKGHIFCGGNPRLQGTQSGVIFKTVFLVQQWSLPKKGQFPPGCRTDLHFVVQGSGKEPSRELTSMCLALGAVPSIGTKPFLCQKPPCPCPGRSSINILHGCSPAFTLCSPKYRFFFCGVVLLPQLMVRFQHMQMLQLMII